MVLPSACPAAGSTNASDDATEATLPPLVIATDDDGLNGDDGTMRCSSSLLDEGGEELNLPTAAAEGHNGCGRGSRTAGGAMRIMRS